MPLPTAFKPIKTDTPKLRSWSYTTWALWKQCPLRAKFRYIDKKKEKMGPAVVRGNKIHTAAENIVKKGRATKATPKPLQPWVPRLLELTMLDASVEDPWAFNKDWEDVEWNDWDNVWVRMKLDVLVKYERHARVIDHKTGKKYDSHKDQGELYAMATFMRDPSIETIDVEFWYIDQKSIDVQEYWRNELPSIVQRWEQRVNRMMNDTTYLPRPSNKCSWCSFAKSKGGPCKYG